MADIEHLRSRIQRLEDLDEIRQLRARYCQCLDDGHWTELAELFTHDGAFIGISTARGRAELVRFFAALGNSHLNAWWHFTSNETITVDGDRAWGETWLDQPCVVEGEAHVAAGRYRDDLVRDVDGRWRFRERKVTFFFWASLASGWYPGRMQWAPARNALDPAYTRCADAPEGQP